MRKEEKEFPHALYTLEKPSDGQETIDGGRALWYCSCMATKSGGRAPSRRCHVAVPFGAGTGQDILNSAVGSASPSSRHPRRRFKMVSTVLTLWTPPWPPRTERMPESTPEGWMARSLPGCTPRARAEPPC